VLPLSIAMGRDVGAADATGKPEGWGPVGAQRRSPANSEGGVIRAAQRLGGGASCPTEIGTSVTPAGTSARRTLGYDAITLGDGAAVTRAIQVDTRTATTVRRVLVISQHEAVRRQLVAYLSRSPALAVSGEPFAPELITRAQPDVLIVDLSQLGPGNLGRAIEAAQGVGARLIALASIREPAEEALVRQADGLYRLKSAGPDGLAETVLETATRRR